MNSIRARLAALRDERGDADPVTVIAGSVLFLLAGIGIAGLLTMTLAASSRAQANTEITQAVESQVSEWKATPYLNVSAVSATEVPVQIKGASGATRTVKVWTQVKQQPSVTGVGSSGAWQVTFAAPRQTLLTTPVNCKPALNARIENCLTLSGTVAPSGFDKVPATPDGLVVTVAPSGRGITLADLNIAKLVDADGDLDVRVAILPAGGAVVPDGLWNLTLTCSDTTALALTPDSRFVKAEKDSKWMTGRVSIHGASSLTGGSCPTPKLRMWADTVIQPTVNSVAVEAGKPQVKAWRVFGG